VKLSVGLLLAFAVLSVAVTAGWTAPLDQSITVALTGHRTEVLNNLAVNLTALGSAPVAAIVALLAALYAVASGRPRIVLALLWTPLSFFLDSGLKLVFQHPRPTEAIIAIPDSYSFPSGHAVAASALYITLALAAATGERRLRPRRVLVWGGVLIAVLVAWSRVYLGVHYLSDVVGGLLLGSAGALAASIALSRTDSHDGAKTLSGP